MRKLSARFAFHPILLFLLFLNTHQKQQAFAQATSAPPSFAKLRLPSRKVNDLQPPASQGKQMTRAASPGQFWQHIQLGAKPFVTILVRFSDSPALTPHPASWYVGLMGSQYWGADHYFRELSYNQINLSGSKVVGWYNLSRPKSFYLSDGGPINTDVAIQEAMALADKDVYFPAFYGVNVMYNDGVNGIAMSRGPYDYQTIDGQTKAYGTTILSAYNHNNAGLAHEMGHALGLGHAQDTYGNEYGSIWNPMGMGYWHSPLAPAGYDGATGLHYNAYQKDKLGWIAPARKCVIPAGTSKTIYLERLAQPTSSSAYLMAQIDVPGSATQWYTVEARFPVGYDAGLKPDGSSVRGQAVLIHKVDVTRNDSQIVDGDNDKDPQDEGVMWEPGETFTDATNGITIAVKSATTTGFNVTITTKTSSLNPSVVTNTNDSGVGSLRNAIYWANRTPNTTIRFNIPGSGARIIAPLSALPDLSGVGTILDGTTQPSYKGLPLIAISGSKAGAYVSGLNITGKSCTVRGLDVSSFAGHGIVVASSGSATKLEGNFVGLAADGRTARPNGWCGIVVGAPQVTIGGLAAGTGNVVSGNAGQGIYLQQTSSTVLIQGNFIGTNNTGTVAVPNGSEGVVFASSNGNTLGGTVAGARNIISGNKGNGVWIEGTSVGSLVQGNFIGTDATGSKLLANKGNGIVLLNTITKTVLGGTVTGARNLISGNEGNGVWIGGGSGTLVQGNYIGTNSTGSGALPNGYQGVVISGSNTNTVGGLVAAARNVISGNKHSGLWLQGTSTGNLVQGNFLGIDASGSKKLGNGNEGIVIVESAAQTTIGGTVAGARNVISGNGANGMWIESASVNGNTVQGNAIGTDVAGTLNLGNGGSGILLPRTSQRTVIGGTATGAGNLIAFNGGAGIQIWDNAVGNPLRGNSMWSNQRIGIDLVGGNGEVTANDSGDGDSGPNNLQNFPVITSVTVKSNVTTLKGTFEGAAFKSYALDIFRSLSADPSGYGEGQIFLPSAKVTVATNASGMATFSVNIAGNFLGQYFSATATNLTTNDTSEFSAIRQAFAPSADSSVRVSMNLKNKKAIGACGQKRTSRGASINVLCLTNKS